MPPFLFHGTYEDDMEAILRDGLNPDLSKCSIKAVFLSIDMDTARNYANHHGSGLDPIREWTILAIETSLIDPDQLIADNCDLADILANATPSDPHHGLKWSDMDAVDSLLLCGQCACTGVIPPIAISRA
jgi:hypothetical protein